MAAQKDDSTERRNGKPPPTQCAPYISRVTRPKRQPSSGVTVPRAKRPKLFEPIPLPGQDSKAESGVNLSIEKVKDATIAK